MDALLILEYALIGGLLARIDRLEDEGLKKNDLEPLILAVLNSFLMGYLIITDTGSAIIFSAVMLGVAFAGKVDNLSFIIGVLISGGALLSRLLYGKFLNFILLPIALAFTAFVDEYGHDRIRKIPGGLLKWFFYHRFTMKFGVMLIAYLGIISVWHFVAFLAFDLCYDLCGRMAR